MTQEVLKQMYQLLLTEPHAPTVCAQLERIAREALAEHARQETQRLGQEIEEPWCMKMNGCKTKCKDCPDEPPQRTEQEPVAWWNDTGTHIDLNVSGRGAPLYTAPPQRTWVGLTKNERLELYRQFEDCLESDDCEYEKAIEAKLKEKNQ